MKYSHKHGAWNAESDNRTGRKINITFSGKALSSSSNSQTIGRNGELPLISFFNRYFPPTFRAAKGHFITPIGEVSP